jgi:hypothetical protein
MNIQNAFPSKWLKSGDVEEGDLNLTIKSVQIEDIGQGDNQETKPVIYFDETDKGMVLNKTNADTISRLHTPETDNWIGKKISIFATEVDFAGKQTLALRVRMKAPKPAQTVSAAKATTNPTEFWSYAYQHDISKTDAAAYLHETGDDFSAALKLMQAQTEAATA